MGTIDWYPTTTKHKKAQTMGCAVAVMYNSLYGLWCMCHYKGHNDIQSIYKFVNP